ncbi:hypothetical protein CHGG_08099 [Chaetomium globosum CBS 148.51]|uniref:Uncharacterized protein n=1 Tax=Chaetomium globosum (strain ATCC 6205 / CBS 148.51 / DSM 1962 / NBRC 6347 / NRRL 1970) TaxID=306901 RepID=Q2GVA5_CHAGB|nr:uncharacterized protein CHGG_08099 [Chaetomium globosum CBS 148.51]EAQ86846.1 hypothetical protein CHGG_08099 [Chaetomium globosum CBS 148.51]
MASRQLRKLQKQKELLNLQHETAGKSGEESSDDEPIITKPRGNMFSGFGALQDDNDDDESNEEEVSHQAHQEQPEVIEPATPAKTSKKKNKKKKKKGKQPNPSAPAQNERKSIDEVDRALEELRLEERPLGGSTVAASADKPTSTLDNLLRINLQHLKAMNEMRRIFGKAIEVADLEQRAEDNQRGVLPREGVDLETFLSARAFQNPGQGRPRGSRSQGNVSHGVFDAALRTNPFIDGKKTWPPGPPLGLKMVRVTDESRDHVEFAFAFDAGYDSLEATFFTLVQMMDPMQIVTFLYRHPYHVSSLLQVSKVARQDQNAALAADLIERAVFAFGRVSLNGFRKKLEMGQARMSFARPENRQFYLAGWNLIQKQVLKGTYRTALEWSKLFLSINHDDPYGMGNWIHVLAIRAYEPKWFIDFCNSDFFNDPSNIYAKQSLPLAYLQLDDTPTAISTLTEGMKTLPWLYCALFSALNLDTPRAVWGIQPRNDDEALHTKLYIHMAKELWNTPQRITLLNQAAAAIPTAVPTANLPPPTPISLATTRFIYLDNTPALMAAVPRNLLHAASPNFEFDPMPPPLADNVFSSPAQRLPWSSLAGVGAGAGAGVGERGHALLAAMQGAGAGVGVGDGADATPAAMARSLAAARAAILDIVELVENPGMVAERLRAAVMGQGGNEDDEGGGDWDGDGPEGNENGNENDDDDGRDEDGSDDDEFEDAVAFQGGAARQWLWLAALRLCGSAVSDGPIFPRLDKTTPDC